jgi:cytochrome d ubiquinol oxidase subunit II
MTTLQMIWYVLLILVLSVYAVLDGFDLGVGLWYPLYHSPEEKKSLLGMIGPVWDGNEVWLLLSGGALFAAFPSAYGTFFSTFYIPAMLILFALVFRAVSLAFIGNLNTSSWKRFWGFALFMGSLFITFLFGFIWGNLIKGLSSELLSPYALFSGVVALTFFFMHGAAYISLRAGKDAEARARKLLFRATVLFGVALAAFLVWTTMEQSMPILMIAIFVLSMAVLAIFWFNLAGKALHAFIVSSCLIVLMIASTAASVFPYLVPMRGGGGITIWEASSSELTLKTMLIIAAIGMPFVIAYTIWIYMKFRGETDVTYENDFVRK